MAGKVKLSSSDGQVFEADVEAMKCQSGVLRGLIEEMGTDAVIPLPNVAGGVLARLITYCELRQRNGLGGVSPFFDSQFGLSSVGSSVRSWPLRPSLFWTVDTVVGNGQEIREDNRRSVAGTKHSASILKVDDWETVEDEKLGREGT